MFKIFLLSLFLINPFSSLSQIKSNTKPITSSIGLQLYPIKNGDNYGYINKIGKIIIKPQFDDAKDFKEGFAKIKISGKFGFIDKTGRIAINPQFEDLQDFSEGLARVKVEGMYGFIDKTGKMVIKPQFEEIEKFSEGLAQIKISGKFGFINRKGEIVSNPQFDEVSYFHEGLAKVKIGTKYGYLNQKGEIAIKPQFYSASNFSEGLANAAIEENVPWKDNSGYIDKTGNFVIKPQFGWLAGDFKNGIASVSINRKYGYIDKTGKFLIHPQFNTAFDFYEGLAWVSYSEDGGNVFASDAKYGCIDKQGKFVLNPQNYFWPGNFSEGLSSVMFRENEGLTKYCYINKTGDIIIKPQFTVAGMFHDGWAKVSLAKDWGIINKNGQFIKGEIIGELIRVWENGNPGYMDKNFNWIWKVK